MAKLIIPVGLPGCGKSTLASRLLDAEVVSSDAIRRKLCPDGYDPSMNDQVFNQYHDLIQRLLLEDTDVIADATNLERSAREKLYAIAERTWAETHVVLFTNASQAIRRNAQRPEIAAHGQMRVPSDVMRDTMLPRYEKTRMVIDTEPHTSITRIESVD